MDEKGNLSAGEMKTAGWREADAGFSRGPGRAQENEFDMYLSDGVRATQRPPRRPSDPQGPQEPQGKRWEIGEAILGRYKVERELGHGGMGVVYGCLDMVGGVQVAVKGLPPEVSRDPSTMEDIRDNFRLVGALRHPGITGVRTLEKDEGGDYYLVMDLAEGQNLRRWAKAHTGPEHMAEKLRIVGEIAAALDYAHSQRIIHRDIKPENVMVDGEGHAHVLDFGLAAQIRTSASKLSQTVSSRSGTPTYKAPEQWRGRPQNEMTDQYSLGVLAYELLSGYLPFDDDDPALLRMSVLGEPVAEIPEMPAYVNHALARAMAKEPGGRFASCEEFVVALGGGKVKSKGSGKASLGAAAAAGGGDGMKKAVVAGVLALVAVVIVVVKLAGVLVGGGGGGGTVSGLIGELPAEDGEAAALALFRKHDWTRGFEMAMSTDRIHPELQFFIGMCHDTKERKAVAHGVEKNDWVAKEWYGKAADQGDGRAMAKLGQFAEEGRGGDADREEAKDWYRRAENAGEPSGAAALKRMEAEETKTAAAKKAAELEAKRRADLAEKEAAGYTIVGGQAIWKAGVERREHPHWVTTATENGWRPADGYTMVNQSAGKWSTVRWTPGWHKSGDNRRKAGDAEGSWLRLEGCSSCGGDGIVESAGNCSGCQGTGRKAVVKNCASCGGRGTKTKSVRCRYCNGRGQVTERCGACRGNGTVSCATCGGSGRVPNPLKQGAEVLNIFRKSNHAVGRSLPDYINCSDCTRGKVTCSRCHGNGEVSMRCDECHGEGELSEEVECLACDGNGKIRENAWCQECQGSGHLTKRQKCMTCGGGGEVWRKE